MLIRLAGACACCGGMLPQAAGACQDRYNLGFAYGMAYGMSNLTHADKQVCNAVQAAVSVSLWYARLADPAQVPSICFNLLQHPETSMPQYTEPLLTA